MNIVDNYTFVLYNRTCRRGVAQLGARVVWDHEVAGSIPVTPTKKELPLGSSFFIINFYTL